MNHQQPPSGTTPPYPSASCHPAAAYDQRTDQAGNYWGAHVMGTPAVPSSHPNNHQAAVPPGGGDPNPYVQMQYTQAQSHRPTSSSNNNTNNPMDNILKKLNSWGSKAEIAANNVWGNLKTGTSVTGSAWGKVNLTAKAVTEGGFESLYKHNFTTYPYEKLKKTFACHLSTSTGPVAGTLYLSNVHVAFCSDRPLSFVQPSGMVSWIYYKVMVPLGRIGTVNPITMSKNQSEKYIHISTTDGHDFWFMGFVNHDKASKHLLESVSAFTASGTPLRIQ